MKRMMLLLALSCLGCQSEQPPPLPQITVQALRPAYDRSVDGPGHGSQLIITSSGWPRHLLICDTDMLADGPSVTCQWSPPDAEALQHSPRTEAPRWR